MIDWISQTWFTSQEQTLHEVFDTGCSYCPDFVVVQTVNTDTSHKQATDSFYGSGGIRWLCFWTVSWYNSTSCSYSTTIYSSKETHSKHRGRSCPACQCRLVDLSVLLETCMPPIVRITMTTCPMQHMSVFLCMEGIILLPYLLKCN